MPQYLLLLNENDHAWANLPPAERDALMKGYMAWVAQLRSENRLKGGDALASGGTVLKAAGAQVTQAPYTATQDVLTGYFVIEADSLPHATQIAHGCPALFHGETVIVRPIADLTTDHAGA